MQKRLFLSTTVHIARVSAHSGVDITISEKACTVPKRDADGKVIRANGKIETEVLNALYDVDTGKIAINPKAKLSASDLIAHESFHAIIAKLGYNKRTAKLIDLARAAMPESKEQQIRAEYTSSNTVSENDANAELILREEVGAHFTEYFNNESFMTALVTEKPSLKKTIIDFLKGAKKSYAKDGKLSRAARKYLNLYSKLFAELSGVNAQGQSLEIKNPSARVADGVRASRAIITAEMTDEERYEVLKDRKLIDIKNVSILPVEIKKKIPELSSWEDINNYLGSRKRKIIHTLAKEFGAINKEYFNEDIQLSFELSNNNFNETYKRQERNFEAFAKMFSVFDNVIDSAVGVEVHNNPNHKYDATLDNIYVLMSAYQDDNDLVPVKLEVKKFKDKQNTLYVAVSLEKIKMTEVLGRGNTENGVTQQPRSVNISIASIFKKINTLDKSFLKYIPDGFLNAEQLESKRVAIKEANDSDYMSAVNRGDMETAQRMVDEAARKNGYDVTTYHGTDKTFTEFKTLYYNEFGYHVGTKKAAEDRIKYNLNGKVLKLYTKLGKTIKTPDVFGYFAGMHDYIFYVRGENGKVSDMEFLKQYGRTRRFGNKFPDNGLLDKLHFAYVEFVESGYKFSKGGMVVEFTQEYLKSIGVDSIAYSNAYEGVGSTSYLLMDSNQVKSADPVTYDDNGNVIPLSERFNPTNKDIRYSRPLPSDADYSNYSKPITQSDISTLRLIGRKSINEFTSDDIKKAQKWAYKFYKELGVKSPFFRAWFGDWRGYDKGERRIVSVPTIDISQASLTSGNYIVEDTGWNVYAGKTLNDDTRHHSGGNRINVKSLNSIEQILNNAILLDTIVSMPDTNKKSPNTAFLHKLYTLIEYDGKTYVAKITVEEFYNQGNNSINRKAYNLKAIKIEPAGGQFRINNSSSSVPVTDPMYSISDLFDLVKTYDAEFSPKSVNPLLLNEDGTPKVFYHGTGATFTEFSPDELSPREGSYFFAENREDAEGYGKNVYGVYLRMDNPADYDNQPREFYQLKSKREQVAWLKERGYDGFYSDIDSGGWAEFSVFSPEQIKSATDNIGTFDSNSRDTRYSRPLTESVGEIATNAYVTGATDTRTTGELMRERLREKKSALSSAALNTQMMFVNEQAGIEQAAVKMGVDRARIESEVQMVRNSYAQAQYMMVGGQYDIFASDPRLITRRKSLKEILDQVKPEDREGFEMYLYHAHNVDRISLNKKRAEKQRAQRRPAR